MSKSRAVFYLYNFLSSRYYSLYDFERAAFFHSFATLFQSEIQRDHDLTFQDAQIRLLAFVEERIHNGELTERAFARMIGISQPHVHHVLKRVRKLSPRISDLILTFFNISITDLTPEAELENNLLKRKRLEPASQLAFLDAPVGPGLPWPESIDWSERFPIPFRSMTLPPGLVVAQLAKDPTMYRTLEDRDVAILDLSARQRTEISPEGLYAVTRDGQTVLRHVRPGASCCYLLNDLVFDVPEHWERVPIGPEGLLALIEARVLWLGRKQHRETDSQPGIFW